MDEALFAEFFVELGAFQPNIHGHPKFILVDNRTGHNITPRLITILKAKQRTLRYLLPCSTLLHQRADTFIFQR